MLPRACHAVGLESSHERDVEGNCCRFWLCSIEITDGTSKSAAAEQGLERCPQIWRKLFQTLLSDSLAPGLHNTFGPCVYVCYSLKMSLYLFVLAWKLALFSV